MTSTQEIVYDEEEKMATTQGIMIFRGKGVIKILDGQI